MPIQFLPVESSLMHQHEWNSKLGKIFTSAKTDILRDSRKSEIECIDWSADGAHIIAVHRNGTVRVWRTDRMTEEQSFTGSWTWAESNPKDPNTFVMVSWDGKLKLVNLLQPADGVEHDLKRNLGDKFDKLLYCTGNSHNQIAIMTRADLVHVINPIAGEVVVSIQPGVDIYSVLFDSRNRLLVAAGGTPGKILIYSPAGVLEKELVAHSHSVMSLARVGHGDLVLSGGADALVALWDTTKDICVRTFPDSISPVTTLACGAGGSLVAWGSGGSKDGENVLSIAGIQTGHHYASIPVQSGVTRVKWHPTENALAYSMQDANIHIVTFPKRDL